MARKTTSGAMIPAKAITIADLEQNGGDYKLATHTAIPINSFDSLDRGLQPIKARAFLVVTEAQIASGEYKLLGGPAQPIYEAGETYEDDGLLAYPVYVIEGEFGSQPVPPAPAFSPTDIAGLALWLDANDLTTLFQDSAGTTPVTADADVVGYWADKSGGSRNFSQATTAKKPTYRTNVINGKATLRFDGTDDLLVRAENFLSSTQGAVVTVFRLNAPIASGELFSSGDEASTERYWICRPYQGGGSPNLTLVQYNNDVEQRSAGNSTIGINENYLVLWGSNGTAYSIRKNGAAETVTAAAGVDNGDWLGDTANRDNFVVGAIKISVETNYLRGDVAELLMYDTMLTAEQIAQVEAYLNAKWAVY